MPVNVTLSRPMHRPAVSETMLSNTSQASSLSRCSLPRLPSPKRGITSEKLAKWMARSSEHIYPAKSLASVDARLSAKRDAHPVSSRLGRSNKTSLLRSGTCPVPLAQLDYSELSRKQKSFVRRCKTMSASSTLPCTLSTGETLHGFLTGARYNSAYTVDTRSLGRCGVHVPKRDNTLVFVNRTIRDPSSSRFPSSTLEPADSREPVSKPDLPINTRSEPNLQDLVVRADSACSIEHQLDEVFGPNEDRSSSDSTVSRCEEPKSEISLMQEDNETPSLRLELTTDHQRSSTSHNPSLVATIADNVPDVLPEVSSTDSPEGTVEVDTVNSQQPLTPNCEEHEQDFISHEAQKLAREILEECQMSTSSLSSHSSVPTANLTQDKSLQTSFVNVADSTIDPQSDNQLGLADNERGKRPVSAVLSRDKARVVLAGRPKSAHVYRETIFVDMTSLQSTAIEEN